MKMVIHYYIAVLCYISCVFSITISPCAKWNTTGITVAGNGKSGSSSRQLSYPQGIFVHNKMKLLYVSDSYNNRIQVFPLDRPTTDGFTLLSRLNQNFKIYVDDDDDTFPSIYIAMASAHRVEQWIKGGVRGIPIGDRCTDCRGVWVDGEKNVYMVEHSRNRVLKWIRSNKTTIVVAGEADKKGSRPNHLSEPEGIVVDKITNALYIADLTNHRIQKWPKDAKEGVTVAGSSDGDPGSDAQSLERPYGLRFDEETKTLYIVDLMNNRIQRWKHGATEGETIAGGNGLGDRADQFYHPTDLDFDSEGNLYVCEAYNHRVQFFELIDNQPCEGPPPSTANSLIHQLPLNFFVILIAIAITIRLF